MAYSKSNACWFLFVQSLLITNNKKERGGPKNNEEGGDENLFFFTWPNRPLYSCGLVSYPLSEREAAVDLVLIQTFFLLLLNLC